MLIPVNKEMLQAEFSAWYMLQCSPKKDCSRTPSKTAIWKQHDWFFSNLESIWRDNLWVMHNSVLTCSHKDEDQEENTRILWQTYSKVRCRAGLWKPSSRMPKGAHLPLDTAAPEIQWQSSIATETLAPCPLPWLLPHMFSSKGILRPKDEPKTWGDFLIIPSMEGLMWHSSFCNSSKYSSGIAIVLLL